MSQRLSSSREGGVRVSEVQRARIFAAMVWLVAKGGMGAATVSRIVKQAGVSRRTFYELFSGSEDCFLAVFDDIAERARKVVIEGGMVAGSSSWREQVRAGLAALLSFFDEEPLSGSFLVVDALGGGPVVLERRTRILGALTAILSAGGAEVKSVTPPPPLAAEGTVGAVLSVIHARMLEEDHRPLLELLNPLMGMIVLPYLGRAVATRELTRPAPPKPSRARTTAAARTPRSRSGDPLAGLNMRLTYRTLVVLSAIATHPRASNRKIAEASGVHDQGQISKLLSRLEKLGLIQNSGNGQAHGEPNAWTLTARGCEIEGALGI